MRLEIITGLQLLIIAFISYVVSITFTGWFEAFVAQQVGDDVPEQAGFLTLNPLDHFNVFGFGAVLWGMFFSHLLPFQIIPGWGRYIPLMPDVIRGRHYKLRIFTEYVGRSLGHLIVLVVAVTLMMLVCGASHVQGVVPLFTSNTTSFKEALTFLLYFICQQNLVLFVIHFILGIFKYLIYFHMPKLQEVSFLTIFFGFILLVVGLSIFGPLLEYCAFKVIEGIRLLLLLIGKQI